jgi:hypothetical protein
MRKSSAAHEVGGSKVVGAPIRCLDTFPQEGRCDTGVGGIAPSSQKVGSLL